MIGYEKKNNSITRNDQRVLPEFDNQESIIKILTPLLLAFVQSND